MPNSIQAASYREIFGPRIFGPRDPPTKNLVEWLQSLLTIKGPEIFGPKPKLWHTHHTWILSAVKQKHRKARELEHGLRELTAGIKALLCARCYVAVIDAGAKKAEGGVGHGGFDRQAHALSVWKLYVDGTRDCFASSRSSSSSSSKSFAP